MHIDRIVVLVCKNREYLPYRFLAVIREYLIVGRSLHGDLLHILSKHIDAIYPNGCCTQIKLGLDIQKPRHVSDAILVDGIVLIRTTVQL